MNRILVGILALGLITCISSQAGTVINKQTNQSISLNVEESPGGKKLIIDGRQSNLDVKEMLLQSRLDYIDASVNSSDQKFSPLFFISKSFLHHEGGGPLLVVSGALDIASLPVTVTMELINDMKSKKDLHTIEDAINTESKIIVSSHRFERIVRILGLKE